MTGILLAWFFGSIPIGVVAGMWLKSRHHQQRR